MDNFYHVLLLSNRAENVVGTNPASWTTDTWGKNTSTLSYKTTEGHTGSKSLYISTTKRTNGDSKWMPSDVIAKPATSYTYSEFYKSNVATEVDIQYTSTTGKLSYAMLSTIPASSTTWGAKTYTFKTPANVKSMSVFHLIEKVGWLQTDDFNLAETNGTSTPLSDRYLRTFARYHFPLSTTSQERLLKIPHPLLLQMFEEIQARIPIIAYDVLHPIH